jgi:PHD/YefM family antitoxin component YafN of YafNO toxin-antitoxin module
VEEMKTQTVSEGSSAAHLLQVADYLSRPQQFLAVAEARSGLRQAMDDASERSIVLTNNGQPQAAIVPFQALEAMRGALLQLLVGGMQVSFERLQQEVVAKTADGQHQPETTTEAELESLVRQARRKLAKPDSNKGKKKRR